MKILVKNENQESWQMVHSAAYRGEKELQKLLSDSPSLIPIPEMRDESGELVAVVREFNLPIGYVDLLGFTADGDIVIIECKLADNPEVKRKVIGQVLEYGSAIWKMRYEILDQKIKERSGHNLADLVGKAVDESDWDEENFRLNVESNLIDGNFILVIVVDEINEGLSNIIRFVNACGNPNFSFAALEMRRFQSGTTEIMVPKVEGDYRPKVQRTPSARRRWNRESFFKDATSKVSTDAVAIMKDLFDWCKENADITRFGTGSANGSFTFVCERDGATGSIFSVYSDGSLSINFGYMEKIFSTEDILSFQKCLAEIPTFVNVVDTDKSHFYLDIYDSLSNQDNLISFKKCIPALSDPLPS